MYIENRQTKQGKHYELLLSAIGVGVLAYAGTYLLAVSPLLIRVLGSILGAGE